MKVIRKDENKISVDNFNYLTDRVGWGTRETKVIDEALNNIILYL